MKEDGLDTRKELTYKLDKLRSFYDYKVYVTAFTVNYSNASNDIHFKTLIGGMYILFL